MSHFTSVRGWLQIFSDTTGDVMRIISDFNERARDYGVSRESADLYMEGWVARKKHINWSSYLFYGADVRTEALPFFESLLREIAEKANYQLNNDIFYPRGVFHIDNEDNEQTVIWKISGGHFEKKVTNFLFSEEYQIPPDT
jgi:hypothetical protein